MEESLPIAGFCVGAYADILSESLTENVSGFYFGVEQVLDR